MGKPSQKAPEQESNTPPRIIADFGGRRRLLDRRLTPSGTRLNERRSGKDRRCGFDRRSALNQDIEIDPEKRQPTDTKIDLDFKF